MATIHVSQERTPRVRTRSDAGRRFGFFVAAVVNAVGLWVAHQVLEWGWPAFITPAWADLLPYLDVSMGAAIAVNLIWVVWNPPWFEHLGQVALNLISLVVTVRVWQIFPFDFSPSSFPWDTVFRVMMVFAVVGLVAATITELARFFRGDRRATPTVE